MGIFDKLKLSPKNAAAKSNALTNSSSDRMLLAQMVLDNITDGVIIIDSNDTIKLINPAAAIMTGFSSPDLAIGINISNVLKFENAEGVPIDDSTNEVLIAILKSENANVRNYVLVNAQRQRKPVAVSIVPVRTGHGEVVITLRDIKTELEHEGEQTEFISTASHEMRTPVASIEGYLGLALNPQCATIDDRARKYLEEAHMSSKHLGRLFQDLLDVTKLDDKKIKLHLTPVEMVDLVRKIVDGLVPAINEKHLKYTFGSANNLISRGGDARSIAQAVYSNIDVDFLREILDNLIENAIKYTKDGGAIWVNVRGDGDRVLINITDTGIGISPDDLTHIFQKFYRVDNSQTREIGGTGLGLYIVKMRVEALGGKVWAESSFGEGSTFYISLPRLTFEEYERRKQIIANNEAMAPTQASGLNPMTGEATNIQPAPAAPQTAMQPQMAAQPIQSAQPIQPAQPAQQVQPTQPIQPAQPAQPSEPFLPQPTPPQPTFSGQSPLPMPQVTQSQPAQQPAQQPPIQQPTSQQPSPGAA